MTRRAIGALLALTLASGCAPVRWLGAGGSGAVEIYELRQPEGARERYCAWYGSPQGGVLYFGQAAFWSTYAEHAGDARADLAQPGPQPIGRFDLRRERFLEPLEVAPRSGPHADARTGVWDVLATTGGRVYFVTYFEPGGYVDTASGGVRHFGPASVGASELAPGPHGALLAGRYADPERDGGSVVILDPDGRPLAEHPLTPPPGLRVAAKSVAWDPVREHIWVTTDLLGPGGDAAGHDARRLDAAGRELARVVEPEIQFVAFGPDGTGYFAEHESGSLWLRVLPPDDPRGAPEGGHRILLDSAFAGELDFAQDIQVADDGRAVVTRWSGSVHVLGPRDELGTLRLPRTSARALYYTGVLQGDRVCVTLCDALHVVCASLP